MAEPKIGDYVSGGQYISRAVHARIEDSNQWIASAVWAAVPSTNAVAFHIKTGANKNAHGVIRISSAAKVTYYIYENPTLTNDGAALANVCQNRQTTAIPDTACLTSPVITANGTLLESGMFGTAGKFTATGEQMENGGYFLLKKSESYLVIVVNDDAGAQDLALAYMWHEE